MGKIHEALKKSGRAEELKRAPLVEPRKIKRLQPKNDIQVIRPASEPYLPADGDMIVDPLLVAYKQPRSVEAEIFKILRTNVLFPKHGEPPKTIMVTSAIPGDGKSFVATNLAVSIAQGIEDHVLLIDCDMRRPKVHRIFGFHDDTPGLSDYLAERLSLRTLLKKTVVDKLTVLPGGQIPPNPSELLSSQSMKQLLMETKNRYSDRYVLIDSPPPHLTSETTALAKYIDGIIVVVKYGATPIEMVVELVETIGREKIIGVVMNEYRIPTMERYGYGQYKQAESG